MGMNTDRRNRVNSGMRSALARLSLALCFVMGIAHFARAAESKKSATDTIKDANATLRTLLAKKAEKGADAKKIDAQITTELRQLFDLADLTKRALVDQWDKMTQTQRDTIVNTMRTIVERNYVDQLKANLEYQIDYTGETKQGDDVLVTTVIKAKSAKGRELKIHVDYLLHLDGDHWRAYDVTTDEVSLVKNYRSQFNRIIGKEGVDGLIKRMQSKLK